MTPEATQYTVCLGESWRGLENTLVLGSPERPLLSGNYRESSQIHNILSLSSALLLLFDLPRSVQWRKLRNRETCNCPQVLWLVSNGTGTVVQVGQGQAYPQYPGRSTVSMQQSFEPFRAFLRDRAFVVVLALLILHGHLPFYAFTHLLSKVSPSC